MKRREINLSLSPEKSVQNLSQEPGIYIFRAGDAILYIGKARNLRNRVRSYLNNSSLNIKSRRLMEKADNLQVTITRNNTEALLLEQTLIKEHHPPYNISLRDDKSYPFIFISDHPSYPLVAVHRGTQKRKGYYYGPYPHASIVHQSIDLLQKIFKVRNCSDSFFSNRSRPCLQYQMHRCSAPCVGMISSSEYQRDVDFVKLFLQGKNSIIIQKLTQEMQGAADKLEYERAGELRNQITALRKLQEQQIVNRASGNVDILAVMSHAHLACVYILYVRQGKILGSRQYFFRSPAFDTEKRLLTDFIAQYYTKPQLNLPQEILLPFDLEDKDLIVPALARDLNIKFTIKPHGDKKGWAAMAAANCKATLLSALENEHNMQKEFEQLNKIIDSRIDIQRIHCFDVSHSSGEATQAACVVFTPQGSHKGDYRRYNIHDINKGDDYAAMEKALMNSYGKKEAADKLPQLILIDGGRGQLNTALKTLASLRIKNVYVMAIAKGEKRKFGHETFYLSKKLFDDNEDIRIMEYPVHSSRKVMTLLLRIRDEAHRFVLHGHKRKRMKILLSSQLNRVHGLGKVRKNSLLKHFGSFKQIRNAGIADIQQAPGFGRKLAQAVFYQLRG